MSESLSFPKISERGQDESLQSQLMVIVCTLIIDLPEH